MEDAKIVELFWARNEDAIKEKDENDKTRWTQARPTGIALYWTLIKILKKDFNCPKGILFYETCFVISFLINHKTGSAIRRCLPD